MLEAVQRELPGTHVLVATAAVADYRPVTVADRKIKKKTEQLALDMTRTTDILATVAARSERPFVVGFAAETDAVEQHALEKLQRKNLDMIAANEVGSSKAFDCEDNALLVLWRGGGRAELSARAEAGIGHRAGRPDRCALRRQVANGSCRIMDEPERRRLQVRILDARLGGEFPLPAYATAGLGGPGSARLYRCAIAARARARRADPHRTVNLRRGSGAGGGDTAALGAGP